MAYNIKHLFPHSEVFRSAAVQQGSAAALQAKAGLLALGWAQGSLTFLSSWDQDQRRTSYLWQALLLAEHRLERATRDNAAQGQGLELAHVILSTLQWSKPVVGPNSGDWYTKRHMVRWLKGVGMEFCLRKNTWWYDSPARYQLETFVRSFHPS